MTDDTAARDVLALAEAARWDRMDPAQSDIDWADRQMAALTAAGFHLHRWQDIGEAKKDGTEYLITNRGHGMVVRIGRHIPLERRLRDEPIDDVWWTEREQINEHHRCGMRPSVFAPLPPAPPEPGR